MNKALFSLLLILSFTQIFAHASHFEIQINNTLVINEKKQLTALKLSFLYDETDSLIMLSGQKNLKKLEKKLINDLDMLGYFTQIKLNGQVLETTRASQYHLEKGKRSALTLHFTLGLKSPVNLYGKNILNLYHEDPSAAAILYYDQASNISWNKPVMKQQCKTSIVEKKGFAEGEFPQIVKIACTVL